jgi:diadenylate cyclase
VVELGTEGRMVELQVQEMLAGVDGMATALARDYGTGENRLELGSLGGLAAEELLDAVLVARQVGLAPGSLDARLPVRGYRQLAQLPRVPAAVAEEVVRHFGSLQALLGASQADLLAVPVVDPAAARVIRDGLGRLAESYDRFDLPG